MESVVGKNDVYLFDPNDAGSVLRKNGKFALIYSGKSELSGEKVIIKQLHPRLQNNSEERKRFRNEFRPDLHLQHVIPCLDLIESGNTLYLIRKFQFGIDLSLFIRASNYRKIRNAGQFRSIAVSICKAVKELHDAGFVHADLKPSNFIIDLSKSKPEVFLLDLGLAFSATEKIYRDPEHPVPFSMIYAAPELMLNFPELGGKRSDIYSLGVILYELLTRESPWTNSNPAILMNLQMVLPLPSNRQLSERINAILQKAACKYPFSSPPNRFPELVQKLNLEEGLKGRYASTDDLIAELEKADEKEFAVRKWFF